MTLYAKVWAVDGETDVPSQIARLMLRSATRNGNGIVEIGDLRVEELDVPGPAVVARDGAFVARGAEDLWQGSYWGYNIGDEQINLTPTSSAGPRSDLIYLRVEDPTSTNGGWAHDPNVDPLAALVVVEGVSSGTTKIPAGTTGIPLARIDRPASTGTVLQEHIVDLRKMLDPRTTSEQFALMGSWTSADSIGNVVFPTWELWPNGAEFPIDVPTWAAEAVISWQVGGAQYISSGGPGGTASNKDARGRTRAVLGTVTTWSSYHWIRNGGGGLGSTADYTRTTIVGGDTIDIPQALRGTTQNLVLQGCAEASDSGNGRIEVDGGSSLTMEITFREVPRYDVPDRTPA